MDGSVANLAIIQTAIRETKRRVKGLYVAFIDQRKAFDSVAHETIITVALEAGVLEHGGYFKPDYTQGVTQLNSERGTG